MPRKSALRKVAAGVVLLGGVALMSGCATEQSRTLEVAKVASAGTTYNGPRSLIAVGKFDNRSSFMRGIFTDGGDRLSRVLYHLPTDRK